MSLSLGESMSFGPFPARSGRFGPIPWVTLFGPNSQVGPIFKKSHFSLIYLFWEKK